MMILFQIEIVNFVADDSFVEMILKSKVLSESGSLRTMNNIWREAATIRNA